MDQKTYWQDIRELNNDPVNSNKKDEFSEDLPMMDLLEGNSSSMPAKRRDFLKMLGFSVTAALASGCELPVRKAVPYLVKPESITPGIANWYASTVFKGGEYASVLVKTRDGRPIKIEGNPNSPVTQGGSSAEAQAMVLSLYDTTRLKAPQKNDGKGNFSDVSWEDADAAITTALNSNPEAVIRILSSTSISPTHGKLLGDFSAKYPNTKVVFYDAVSASGLLEATRNYYGVNTIPSYHFDKADVIVSFGNDFLGSGLSKVEYIKGYSKNRKLSKANPSMSRHYQFESRMSLTGSNADYRVSLKPSEQPMALLMLYNMLASKAGTSTMGQVGSLEDAGKQEKLAKAANDLWSKRGKSLVLSGSNDPNVQAIVHGINDLLGNTGATITLQDGLNLRKGSDSEMTGLISELNAGSVDMLIIHDANPAYDYADSKAFNEAAAKAGMTVSLSPYIDETAAVADYICPDHHILEAWNDAEPKRGHYSIVQPTIRPLFSTRQAEESLMKWAGLEGNYYDYLKNNWLTNNLAGELMPTDAWNKAVQKGVWSSGSVETTEASDEIVGVSITDAASAVRKVYQAAINQNAGSLELELYTKPAIGNGAFANNPWLQETPDPISKITWDNYVNVSPAWASENGFTQGEVVRVSRGDNNIELPLITQPGQQYGSCSIALGYGRSRSGKAGDGVGANAYPFVEMVNGTRSYQTGAVSLNKTGKMAVLAMTQTHHAIHDGNIKRPIVKETTLDHYKEDHHAGNEDREKILHHLDTFYPDRFGPGVGPHWTLSIDLNSCIGCAVCHVSCQAENNIPVVGKKEVSRVHEMHWMRIDRYYAGDTENPEVVYQPMMCQHCDNAPCENVCPVAATNHSSEGLNQMAYNRCIGTRYCANNCPYKVRRFNWFDYMGADSFGKANDMDSELMMAELPRMVLNPDVTVRSRGVMEKCSFCVQRIQEGKLEAKKAGKALEDGAIKTACQTACPADAIIFGDLNNEASEVHKKVEKDERTFRVLEDLHTLPSVYYMTKVRNKDAADHMHDKEFKI